MSVDRAASTARILRATSATLSLTVYDGTVLANPGALTVTVTRADGTALKTDAATSGTGATARTLALSAAETADLDELALVWEAADGTTYRTEASIVGGHLFSLAALRAFDKRQLEDASDYPDALLAAARDRVSEAIEQVTGVAWVPRYRLATLDVPRGWRVLLPDPRLRRLRSVASRAAGTATWTAFTADELATVVVHPGGWLVAEGAGWGAGTQNLRVGYEYGEDRPPLELARAALKWLSASAVPTLLPERATSLSDDTGTFSLWTPGLRDAVSGIPEVDEVLARYAARVPGVG